MKVKLVVVGLVATAFVAGVMVGAFGSNYNGFNARQWASEAEAKSQLAEEWYNDEKELEKEFFDMKQCINQATTIEQHKRCGM